MVRIEYEKKDILKPESVRQLCIRNNFYTRGSCEEYYKMFKLCEEYTANNKQETLVRIAWDIVDHSDNEELSDYGFETVYEVVAWVMGLLVREAMFTDFKAIETEA